jgi:hypothetical protein
VKLILPNQKSFKINVLKPFKKYGDPAGAKLELLIGRFKTFM